MTEPTFYIKNIPIYGPAILAPMAGYSDLPFRSLCREFGSAISYTEFVAVESILHGNRKSLDLLAYDPAERPVTFQIFGNDVELIRRAARQIEALKPDIIDVNMGCSAKTVARRGAGAGLMRTPQKIAEIFSVLTGELTVPVTGKIRLGWDDNSLNYLEIARILEDNGASAIAVHARTKMQAYHGAANWDAIAEIKQAVSIPVIGNGDVVSVADIGRLQTHTGCDAVMIGRAAVGNPWIFAGKKLDEVTMADRIEVIHRHLQKMIGFYGPDRGLILFRKHVVKYTRGLYGGAQVRAKMVRCTDVNEFLALVDEYAAAL